MRRIARQDAGRALPRERSRVPAHRRNMSGAVSSPRTQYLRITIYALHQ